jgi:hypothetical protein
MVPAQFAHPVAGDGVIITPIMGNLGENHVFDNSFTWAGRLLLLSGLRWYVPFFW